MNCQPLSTHPQPSLGAGAAQGQFVLLDMLVPGFSIFSSFVKATTGVDLNVYIPLLVFLCGTMWAWLYVSGHLHGAIRKHLMSSVRIRTDDEIFNMVMAWAASQPFSQHSRKFIANVNINSRSWNIWHWHNNHGENEGEGDPPHSKSGHNKRSLHYTPSYGSHLFWYKGRPCFFERMENRENQGSLLASEKEELFISCFGRNPKLLKAILLEAQEQFVERDQRKTLIYRGVFEREPGWRRCMSRSPRPFSTVILEEKIKQDLIDDVADYLNPATQFWYANRGIPYRRGYLLHGPPGTGKSSISLALAGFFKMRIYILSLNSSLATEENVASLFSSLPRKCLVLLEDIDTAGLTHTREEDPLPATPTTDMSKQNSTTTTTAIGRMSLSGLLNILDGVASQEGRVLIMTTNHIENLDKALIRPGRVDKLVAFSRADTAMAASIFRTIYAPYDGEESLSHVYRFSSSKILESPSDTSLEKQDDENEDEEQRKVRKEKMKKAVMEATLARVDELSRKFAAGMPVNEFSPAEIQGHLLQHKMDPVMAIESLQGWVEKTRKARAEKEVRDAEEKRKTVEKAKGEENKENKGKSG